MLMPPGLAAMRAIDDAEKMIGVTENGPPYENAGTAVETYLSFVGLGKGNPWCAAFVDYREIMAARALGIVLPDNFPRGTFAAAANNWADWAKEHGRWFTQDVMKPLRGDLVCYDIVSEGGIHHMGIVSKNGNATGFEAVEGNTRKDDSDPVRDGYCVARRVRTYSNLGPGGGFIRLGW